MSAVEAIQNRCLEEMRSAKLSGEDRLECFKRFKDTEPDTQLMEQFYDVWADHHLDEDMKLAEYDAPARVARLLQEVFPADKSRKKIKILDVAAGTGLCGEALSAFGYAHIDAVDGSPVSLKVARSRGVYNHLYAERIVKGKKLASVPEQSYDAIVVAGAFSPSHLSGDCVASFLDCLKQGGKLILSSTPHSDEGVGLRVALKQLEADGAIEIKREEYVAAGFLDGDGTLWDCVKLRGVLNNKEE
eukprot:CAMPEP_0117669292 /NCGR_PEP_ID=MMETSP0804-20121206/12047_1 /TAXON_ID=1074897 /ORGANISM="Tetraselmis astigmatica, Strain CCMP880" /LENGTH=244 /DNA_ID=CAMNT_0005477325 /DNA_START=75 /DNA_END=809 /DNA_ORIENTATION=-